MGEPLASAVVRIAADDQPLKGNLARLSVLLHEVAGCLDRYCAESETEVPAALWPSRENALTIVATPDVLEDK